MTQKKAFTLFELLIVVSLIGLFFIFITPTLIRSQSVSKETNVTQIKEYIRQYHLKNNIKTKISFVCKKGYKGCKLLADGKELEHGITFKLANPDVSAFYDVDTTGEVYEKNFDGTKITVADKSVFFEFRVDHRGFSDAMIVFDGKSYFVIDALSMNVAEYKSLEEAKRAYVKYDKMPINDSKYFFNE